MPEFGVTLLVGALTLFALFAVFQALSLWLAPPEEWEERWGRARGFASWLERGAASRDSAGHGPDGRQERGSRP